MREHEPHQSEQQQPRRAFGTLTVLAGMLAAGILGVGSWLQVSGDSAGENHASLGPLANSPSHRDSASGQNRIDRPSISPAVEPTRATETGEPQAATQSATDREGSPAEASQTAEAASVSAAQTAAWKQAILGKWKQYSHGERLLTVNADGTAAIDVTLDFASALLFGEKLHFDIKWTLENDRLVFRTTGGTPEAGVNAVLKVYGDSRTYTIREINDTKMLLTEEGQQKTAWDRVLE